MRGRTGQFAPWSGELTLALVQDANARARRWLSRDPPPLPKARGRHAWSAAPRAREVASRLLPGRLQRPSRDLLCGSTRCLTIPIVSSILEIEKESLPVRRLAQVS